MDINRRLDDIFGWFNNEMKQGDAGMVRCGEALDAVDVTALDENLIVGYLCATYPARHRIPSRAAFHERAMAQLRQLVGEDEANRAFAKLG